jgi:hypothetical protein
MNARRHGLLLLAILVLAFCLDIYSVHAFTPRQQQAPETPVRDDRPRPPTALDTSPPPSNPIPPPGTLGIARFHLDRYAAEPLEKAIRDTVKTFNALLKSFVRLPVTMGLATPLQVVQNSPRNKTVEFFEPDGYPPEPWSRLKQVTSTEYVYETAWGEYRFSKSLPVFRYFSHEEGFCRSWDTSNSTATPTCLDFYSNRPYNTTSVFWLTLGGGYGLPAGYTVWRADNTVFQAEARVTRLTSTYAMRMTWDFMRSRYGPKITVEVWKVSGPTRDFQVVWAGLARGVVDAVGLDVGSLARVDMPLGMRTGLRLSFQTGPPDTWKQYLRVDWGDEGSAETWLANINILGLSFYGWLVRYGLNDALIDPSVNVFGPTTVDPGFNTTGEKTLLTMSTTLPAGGKNVIVCVFLPSSNFQSSIAYGTFRIKKGATVLTDTTVVEAPSQGGERAQGAFVLAVDNNPTGNDSYTFVFNITSAGTGTGVVHVQGMVIKADDALFNANTGYVSVAAGATATVLSLPTTYPANSKVAVLAYMLSGQNSYSGIVYTTDDYGRIKRGTSIISLTQFNTGMWWGSGYPILPSRTVLIAYDTPPTSNPTYSVEFYNSGEAKILAFVPKSGQTFTVSLTETLTASDVLARIPNYVRVLAETLMATDSLSRLQTLARTMAET